MKTKEQLAIERAEIATTREQLKQWIDGGAPKDHATWDFTRARNFNLAVKRALQFLQKNTAHHQYGTRGSK